MTTLQTTVKNLYDALFRRGVKASREDISKQVELRSSDGKLTSDQRDEIVQYFVNLSSQMTVTVDEAGNIENNTESVESNPPALNNRMIPYQPVNNEGGKISRTEATSIIFEQVEMLNLDLKSSEIKQISNDLYDQSLDGQDSILYAVELLKNYISKEEESFTNNLTSAMGGLVEHVNNSYKHRNDITSQAFSQVAKDIEASRTAYKRSCQDFKNDLESHFKIKDTE